jgi:hypothetical protein
MSGEERPVGAEDRWLRQNDDWLEGGLAWLRARLERIAGPEPAQEARPSPPQETEWRLFRRRDEVRPDRALPPGRRIGSVEEAAARMEEAEAVDPPPALRILGARLGLSRFEQDVLLLCAAVELDTGIAGLCARAQGDPERAHPTFALALSLFDDPAWDVLSPERPLRFWRLIEITQPAGRPLTSSAIRADERILNYLKGLNYLDDRLAPLLAPFDVPEDEPLVPSQDEACTAVAQRLRSETGDGRRALVQLVGTDSASKQLVARHATRAMALNLYRLPVASLPGDGPELETLARLWQRESVLLPVALYLDAHDDDGAPPAGDGAARRGSPLQRFVARSGGIFLVSTREVRSDLVAAVHAVEVAKPTPAEQRAVWADALGADADESPARLAGQFDLDASTIRRIARTARAEGSLSGLPERLWRACLVRTAPRMDQLAQRLDPLATWDDLVLPPEATGLLRRLAAQVAQRSRVYDDWGFRGRMNRGFGITALFAGESGTGKTMAAEVIANELDLHLYRIDLSAVVSKYIGETEKNLRRLFDAAEDGGAILFFDEADALFGKRSEVRDSHDRYANIEINYLLQRMEAYRGLAILATNMRAALDDAFVRRLRFIVTFPFPGRTQRRAIWERSWPAATPVDRLDHDRLARLNLSGGNIASVALAASFLAAERGAAVTMPIVLEAARAEYQKLDRPVNEAEFAWNGTSPPNTRTASARGAVAAASPLATTNPEGTA